MPASKPASRLTGSMNRVAVHRLPCRARWRPARRSPRRPRRCPDQTGSPARPGRRRRAGSPHIADVGRPHDAGGPGRRRAGEIAHVAHHPVVVAVGVEDLGRGEDLAGPQGPLEPGDEEAAHDAATARRRREIGAREAARMARQASISAALRAGDQPSSGAIAAAAAVERRQSRRRCRTRPARCGAPSSPPASARLRRAPRASLPPPVRRRPWRWRRPPRHRGRPAARRRAWPCRRRSSARDRLAGVDVAADQGLLGRRGWRAACAPAPPRSCRPPARPSAGRR